MNDKLCSLLLISLFLGCRGGYIWFPNILGDLLHDSENISDKKCPILQLDTCPKNDEVTYWLSTSSTKGQVRLDPRNLQKAPFIKGPLKVWIFGFTTNHADGFVEKTLKDMLTRGQYNIVVVDWNTYTKAGCFQQAVESLPALGPCVARFISALLKAYPFNNWHLLGHSLGAHLAAWTSDNLNGLPRLTRFDPALPLKKNTRKGEAAFIDVYHTNCDVAGQRVPVGDVDVYFNSETFMPGCECDVICSHLRCVDYFVESISKPMIAFPCHSWEAYVTNKCPVPKTGDLVKVGDSIDPKTRGIFMVFTNSQPPFLLDNTTYIQPTVFESFKKTLINKECSMAKSQIFVKDHTAPKV